MRNNVEGKTHPTPTTTTTFAEATSATCTCSNKNGQPLSQGRPATHKRLGGQNKARTMVPARSVEDSRPLPGQSAAPRDGRDHARTVGVMPGRSPWFRRRRWDWPPVLVSHPSSNSIPSLQCCASRAAPTNTKPPLPARRLRMTTAAGPGKVSRAQEDQLRLQLIPKVTIAVSWFLFAKRRNGEIRMAILGFKMLTLTSVLP